jgi:predicted alpha/beta-fold hydrolase
MVKDMFFRGECLKNEQNFSVYTRTLYGDIFGDLCTKRHYFSHAEIKAKGYYLSGCILCIYAGLRRLVQSESGQQPPR